MSDTAPYDHEAPGVWVEVDGARMQQSPPSLPPSYTQQLEAEIKDLKAERLRIGQFAMKWRQERDESRKELDEHKKMSAFLSGDPTNKREYQ